jgi:glyoxylase-like metal-dependent hydrolase (beta-lactamase superfamily II)
VALFEPERGWLFSGDLYLAPRLRYLRADEDVYAMMDSLRRALALEPRVLFCQHRGRVEQGAARLRDKLDFLVELGGRIHDLHGRGWGNAAIARALPGCDLFWRVWTGGDFSKRNVVRAFLRTASAR